MRIACDATTHALPPLRVFRRDPRASRGTPDALRTLRLDDQSEPPDIEGSSWREIEKSLETHARDAESIPSLRDLDTRIDAREPSTVHG